MADLGAVFTISKLQIKGAGDAAITWLETELGNGWLVDIILERVRGRWDTAGVDAVAKLLTDLGWTVT